MRARCAGDTARRPPVAVGGVGGSGTRVVAEALRQLGFYMGRDLNESCDNLWFTLLFKRVEVLDLGAHEFELLVGLFLNAMRPGRPLTAEERALVVRLARDERPQHTSSWLRARADSLLAASLADRDPRARWGWKEPNLHMVIDRWLPLEPELKYVHVIRNGLDMALSENQNQLHLWGESVLGKVDARATPRESLRFWCATHQRIVKLASANPERILLLNFDQLCRQPIEVWRDVLAFVDVEAVGEVLENLARGISPPAGMGRFKSLALEDVDPADVDYVRSLGFDTVVN